MLLDIRSNLINGWRAVASFLSCGLKLKDRVLVCKNNNKRHCTATHGDFVIDSLLDLITVVVCVFIIDYQNILFTCPVHYLDQKDLKYKKMMKVFCLS